MEQNPTETTGNKAPEAAIRDDSIANELIRARTALGWTQNELHQRTGISRGVIKSYESGRNKPGAREIRLLCEALKISPNKLLFGKDEYAKSYSRAQKLVNTYEANGLPRNLAQTFSLLILFHSFTEEERDAILVLCESILTGRRGDIADKVSEATALSFLVSQPQFISMLNELTPYLKDLYKKIEKSDLPEK